MLRKKIFLTAFFVFFLSGLDVWAGEDYNRLILPIGSSPQIGSENAVLTIIEFVDFQ